MINNNRSILTGIIQRVEQPPDDPRIPQPDSGSEQEAERRARQNKTHLELLVGTVTPGRFCWLHVQNRTNTDGLAACIRTQTVPLPISTPEPGPVLVLTFLFLLNICLMIHQNQVEWNRTWIRTEWFHLNFNLIL